MEPLIGKPFQAMPENTMALFHRVFFETAEGRIVLDKILNDLGYYRYEALSLEEMVEYNVARRILSYCGKLGFSTEADRLQFIESLRRIPLPMPEEK